MKNKLGKKIQDLYVIYCPNYPGSDEYGTLGNVQNKFAIIRRWNGQPMTLFRSQAL